MNGGPSGTIEQVETDDAVGVDVRVPRYRMFGVLDKGDLGGLADRELAIGTDHRGGEYSICTSIGYCGLKLNLSLYVSPS